MKPCDYTATKEQWLNIIENYGNLYFRKYKIIKHNKDYKFFILSGHQPNFTLLDKALHELQIKTYHLLGTTTATEPDWKAYHNKIVNRETFLNDIINDQFIDWSFDGKEYTGVHKHYFISQLEKAETHAAYYAKFILIENVATAAKVKELYPGALILFFHENYTNNLNKSCDYNIIGSAQEAENGVIAIAREYLNVK